LTTVYAVQQGAIVCRPIRTLFFPITYSTYSTCTCMLFRRETYGSPCRPSCIDPRSGWTVSSLENKCLGWTASVTVHPHFKHCAYVDSCLEIMYKLLQYTVHAATKQFSLHTGWAKLSDTTFTFLLVTN